MSGRPLLAATSSSGEVHPNASSSSSVSPSSSSATQQQRPKRVLIESACTACRKRKSRCDGARPSCGKCTSLRTPCEYQVEEGESRWSALRRKNSELEAERDDLRDFIADLRTCPELEAQELLLRLRQAGYQDDDDILSIVRQLRAAASSYFPLHPHLPPRFHGPGDVTLPPLRQVVQMPLTQGGPSAAGDRRTASLGAAPPQDGTRRQHVPFRSERTL